MSFASSLIGAGIGGVTKGIGSLIAGNTAYLPNFTLTSAKAILSGRYVK